MKPQEFNAYLAAGLLKSVAISRPEPGAPWCVFARGDALPAGTNPAIELDDGSLRSWGTLDAAHTFLRKHGWPGKIEIDEPQPGQRATEK